MLGQHPQTYGLPELNLFMGDTLEEAWGGPARMFPHRRDGLLRTIAELAEGAQTDDSIARAREWAEEHGSWSIKTIFEFLQEAVGDRVLVEKGPSLTVFPRSMERMRHFYPEASYLHLLRHPRSTGNSLMSLREAYDRSGETANTGNLMDPEKVWAKCHGNATAFAQSLAPGQCMRIKGEWVMSDPRTFLPQICDWLGLDSGPDAIEAMLHPEDSPYSCVGPDAAPYGNDPNFLKAPVLDWDRLANIREGTLDGEIDWRPGEYFGEHTIRLARQFGYG